MTSRLSFLNARRWFILIWLVIFLSSIYLLTYSGRIESNDTRTLFNATASVVDYNDLLLDKTSWYNQPSPLNSPQQYPLTEFQAEQLPVILAAPLYWLAEHLPGIGLVHSVWLFNVFVSAAIGTLMFGYGLTLGYNERTALLGAILLGLTTAIWPYSKSFFREPLACLMILTSAFLLERWRAGRSIRILAMGLVALAGALLTKDAAIMALPALFILVTPSLKLKSSWQDRMHSVVKWLLISLIGGFSVFLLASLLTAPSDLKAIYGLIGRLTGRLATTIETMHIALHSYLFSIGGSVWGTSPITLLAIPGLWILYRRRQYRYLAAIPLLALSFALGYAVLRGVHWFGGLSWPPRFLLPVIPFLMIGTLPVLERLTQSRRSSWVVLGLIALTIYSFWIQITGISLDWGTYNAALPPEAHGLGEWGGGLNIMSYLRWVLIPTLWSQFPLDFIWVRTGIASWPLAFLTLGSGALIQLRGLVREENSSLVRRWWIPIVGLIVLTVFIYGSLRAIYRDSLYLGDQSGLHAMLPIIQSETRVDDVMVLANNNYEPFFLNYGGFNAPRVITLPDQPGERSAPGEALQIISENPDALLVKETIPLLHNLAAAHPHLWLLADSSHWLTWSVRPVERFMVMHYFPIQEFSTIPPDPRIRLIEYSTTPAPDAFGFRGPNSLTDLRFGDAIRLIGFTLPTRNTYHTGEILPLSLYWQTSQKLEADYTVAWFLADENNIPAVQGFDSQPAWGLAPTSQWKPGQPLWDNRALRLPGDLKPGQYHLWIKLYTYDSAGQIQLLPASGSTVVEETIGVLPVSIDIQPA